MFLAQVFVIRVENNQNDLSFRFILDHTNWMARFPGMHTTLGKHEN